MKSREIRWKKKDSKKKNELLWKKIQLKMIQNESSIIAEVLLYISQLGM